MGNSASKSETKVFTPSTPVDFSASFLSQLEGSTQSDYSRAQHTEKYIQDRVAAELAKLERETLKKFKDTTDKSLETSSYEGPSVSGANDKIADLTKRLQDNISKAKVQTSDEFNSAREQVIKCLRDNEGRSLNCWDEVQQFRKLANEL
ncbi:MICOS complex subunit MIC19 [Meyerozyma sp. JA9]|nr:MICOS complex subunit MIC19 [Meyerozyma sp. JA9]